MLEYGLKNVGRSCFNVDSYPSDIIVLEFSPAGKGGTYRSFSEPWIHRRQKTFKKTWPCELPTSHTIPVSHYLQDTAMLRWAVGMSQVGSSAVGHN